MRNPPPKAKLAQGPTAGDVRGAALGVAAAAAADNDNQDPGGGGDDHDVEGEWLAQELANIMDEGSGDELVEDHGPVSELAEDMLGVPLDEDGFAEDLCPPDAPDAQVEAIEPTDEIGPLAAASPDTRTTVQEELMQHVAPAILKVYDAKQTLATSGGIDINNGQISLIVRGDEVMWVHWTDVAAWECRPVVVKGRHNVVQAIVPFRVPKIQVWGPAS